MLEFSVFREREAAGSIVGPDGRSNSWPPSGLATEAVSEGWRNTEPYDGCGAMHGVKTQMPTIFAPSEGGIGF